MSNSKSDARLLDDTRKFVKETESRLKRNKRVPDDARKEIASQLNELRHCAKEDDVAEVEEKRRHIERLVEQHVAPTEKSAWREYAESIAIAVMLALFLRGFVVEAFKIPTGSMIPTLLVGDHLFVNKFLYGIRIPFTKHYVVEFEEPQRGEVVVFSFPAEEAREHLATKPSGDRRCIDPQSLHSEKDMIKRIIGVAGDTVQVEKNVVILNGEPLEREFVTKEVTGNYMYPYEILERETLPDGATYTVRFRGGGQDMPEIQIKPGHVFVMGDNRDNSADGRCWGQVPVQNIKGHAMVIWWSIGPDGVRWERFGQSIK